MPPDEEPDDPDSSPPPDRGTAGCIVLFLGFVVGISTILAILNPRSYILTIIAVVSGMLWVAAIAIWRMLSTLSQIKVRYSLGQMMLVMLWGTGSVTCIVGARGSAEWLTAGLVGLLVLGAYLIGKLARAGSDAPAEDDEAK